MVNYLTAFSTDIKNQLIALEFKFFGNGFGSKNQFGNDFMMIILKMNN